MSSNIEDISCHARISDVRSHLGLSQADLAARLGLPLRSYQNYERGEREAPTSLVRGLYELFRVSPIWLLTGQGAMQDTSGHEKEIDSNLLGQVIEAVETFSSDLPKLLRIDHKARLITLLYEKARLLAEVSGSDLDNEQIKQILKLVA